MLGGHARVGRLYFQMNLGYQNSNVFRFINFLEFLHVQKSVVKNEFLKQAHFRFTKTCLGK